MWLEATRGHRSQGPVRTPSRALPTLDLNSQLATTRGAHPNPGRTAGRGCFGPGTAPHAARSPPTRGPLAPQALRAGAEPRGPEPGGPGTASIFSLPPGAERGGRGTPAAQSAPPLARPPPPPSSSAVLPTRPVTCGQPLLEGGRVLAGRHQRRQHHQGQRSPHSARRRHDRGGTEDHSEPRAALAPCPRTGRGGHLGGGGGR